MHEDGILLWAVVVALREGEAMVKIEAKGTLKAGKRIQEYLLIAYLFRIAEDPLQEQRGKAAATEAGTHIEPLEFRAS